MICDDLICVASIQRALNERVVGVTVPGTSKQVRNVNRLNATYDISLPNVVVL